MILGSLSFNNKNAVSIKLLFSASSSIGKPRYHNFPSFPSINVILLSQLEVAIKPGSCDKYPKFFSKDLISTTSGPNIESRTGNSISLFDCPSLIVIFLSVIFK